MVAEILARQWVTKEVIEQTRQAIAAGTINGPLHEALKAQRLISHDQSVHLEEFIHKNTRIGDFIVERKLGSGAMGDVFLAHHVDDLETRVALKVINKRFAVDEQFLKRFEREIEVLTEIEHPNIANAIGYGTHDGLPFLAMEYVPGPSLAALLHQHGPLPETYVLRIAIQVAEGLDHVWEQVQLVHRDLKPENILTYPDPDKPNANLYERQDGAKLIDFGLARNYGEDDRLTMTGITMGTPHYMSPEQIRGSQQLDQRSDIYGLAGTMYHLLTGRTPYDGTSPGSVMTAHLTEPVPNPRNVVPSITDTTNKLVMMGMAKNADDRYLSYQGFINACRDALNQLGATSSNTFRLVRKPLVVNKTTSRNRRESQGAATKGTSARLEPTSDRDSDQSALVGEAPGGGHKVAHRPATEALRAAGSKRVKTGRYSMQDAPSNFGAGDPTEPTSASFKVRRPLTDSEAISRADAMDPGVGFVPRLVMALSVVAFVGVLTWRFIL